METASRTTAACMSVDQGNGEVTVPLRKAMLTSPTARVKVDKGRKMEEEERKAER